MWRWQSVQEFQYPVDRVPVGPQGTAAVHRPRIGRRGPRAQLDERDHRADARRLRHRAVAIRPSVHGLGQCERTGASGSTASIVATPTTVAAAIPQARWRQQLGLHEPGAADSTRRSAGTTPRRNSCQPRVSGTGDKGHLKTVEAVKWMDEFHHRPATTYPRTSNVQVRSTRTATTGTTSSHARLQQRRAEDRLRIRNAARSRRLRHARRVHDAPQRDR